MVTKSQRKRGPSTLIRFGIKPESVPRVRVAIHKLKTVYGQKSPALLDSASMVVYGQEFEEVKRVVEEALEKAFGKG